jgi:hypothetical protein
MPEHRLQRTRAAYEPHECDRAVPTTGTRIPVLVDRETAIAALARAIAQASRQLRQISRPMQ